MATLHRPARLASGAVAAALVLLPLTACSFSSGNVSCSNGECTATLSGDGATATVLGTEISFGGTQDGRASLSVGDTSVSCGEGESVSLGPLSLTCTTVTTDSVEISASVN
ncbi:hypothetical protein [Modestobacter italicus]|uniref:hypothetical protein n=1 Tax=Modestobacter italicus (strain DSM 44449 / CECT 9708 / BC 501) TaxID=2732864 RepID=UPI001C985E41|nr:hypothetical protein [Modestobacter italicus]